MNKLVIFFRDNSKPLVYHINEKVNKVSRLVRRIMKADDNSLIEIWLSSTEVVFLYKRDIKLCAIHSGRSGYDDDESSSNVNERR